MKKRNRNKFKANSQPRPSDDLGVPSLFSQESARLKSYPQIDWKSKFEDTLNDFQDQLCKHQNDLQLMRAIFHESSNNPLSDGWFKTRLYQRDPEAELGKIEERLDQIKGLSRKVEASLQEAYNNQN